MLGVAAEAHPEVKVTGPQGSEKPTLTAVMHMSSANDMQQLQGFQLDSMIAMPNPLGQG